MPRLVRVEADWAAVDKPSGTAVHRTRGAESGPPLLQWARDALGGRHLYPVHRLDAGASGLVLFARSPEAAAAIQAAWADPATRKVYWAAVRGDAPPRPGSTTRCRGTTAGPGPPR